MIIRQSKVEDFSKLIKGKKNVYCFGAGETLIKFLIYYSGYFIENEIKKIVDNSPKKQGTKMQCIDKCISIISPEQMIKEISMDDVILITTFRFSEIVKQLKIYNQLENIECYFCYDLEMNQEDYEKEEAVMTKSNMSRGDIRIPKIIHYCWFGKNEIPKENRLWMESWKKYCPDYRIIEWNESNYDVSKNLYMKQAYESKKWAFVSDYVRLDVVEQYGGVYFDTDVELIKNIDELLKNEAFCGFEKRQYVNFGLGFGAIKSHKLIKQLKLDYEKRKFILENGKLNETTCPIYQTELLERIGLKRNGQFQVLEGITVYPIRVLCAMSPYSFQIMKNLDYSYSIHHFAGSWIEKRKQNNSVCWEAFT